MQSSWDGQGGVVRWRKFDFKRVNPLKTRFGGSSRKVQTEDIIKEVKRHSFYLKPGERKRVKAALARKRSRKKARKEQD
jgi:small subunit ribosomal protein S21